MLQGIISSQKHFTVGSCLNSLSNIRQKEYNIALYERDKTINPLLQSFINALAEKGFEDFKETIKPVEIGALLYKHFKALHLMGLDLFVNDITELLTTFSQISKSPTIRVSLSYVTNDQCRVFHTDIMDLRMLCTYYGEGTLWVENDNVNWKEYGCCYEEEKIILDKSQIHQLLPFDVALFKGALYPDNSINAVLHRSPAIEELNQKRILLRFDTNTFINELT